MKIGVVIPARNEETHLGTTLEHLLDQTLRPDKIIVMDDGSTDRTAEIAEECGASVVRLPDRGHSAVGMPELADVLNKGFEALDETNGFDYVMVLGADHVLPCEYVEKIMARMESDENLVMASGRLSGERFYPDAPVASGRFYRLKFMKEIGCFPLNYGWEDYPLFKALMLGYTIRCFEDIVTSEQRPIRLSSIKLYSLGKGMKALGYDPLYFLGKCALTFFRTPKGALSTLRGYLDPNVQKYSDLKDFTRKWQRKKIWKRLKEAVGV